MSLSVSVRDLQKFGDALGEYVKKVQVHGFKHARSIALFSGSQHFSDLLSNKYSSDLDNDSSDSDDESGEAITFNWDTDPFLQSAEIKELKSEVFDKSATDKKIKTHVIRILSKFLKRVKIMVKTANPGNYAFITANTFGRLINYLCTIDTNVIDVLFAKTLSEGTKRISRVRQILNSIALPNNSLVDVSEEDIKAKVDEIIAKL